MIYEVVKGDLVIGEVKVNGEDVVGAKLGRGLIQMFLPEGVSCLETLKQWVSKRLKYGSKSISEYILHREAIGISKEDNYWLRLKGSNMRWANVYK